MNSFGGLRVYPLQLLSRIWSCKKDPFLPPDESLSTKNMHRLLDLKYIILYCLVLKYIDYKF